MPLVTLEDWETGRSKPSEAEQAYLEVIATMADEVAARLAERKGFLDRKVAESKA